jgi:hypothetical protein
MGRSALGDFLHTSSRLRCHFRLARNNPLFVNEAIVKTYITSALLGLVGLLNLPNAPEPLPQPQQAAEDVSAFVQPPVCDCDCDCDPERMEKLEALIAEVQADHDSDVEALAKRVVALEAKPVQQVPTPAPVLMPAPAVKPQPKSIVQAPVVQRQSVVQSYAPRWNNFDGKDRMQHAAEDHGIDTSRYTQAQVLAMMDADHDRYGGSNHSAIRATRTREVTRYPIVQQPILQRTYQSTMSNCPGGVCPTQPTYQRTTNTVRRGLFFRR